jgi:hypothetical protein
MRNVNRLGREGNLDVCRQPTVIQLRSRSMTSNPANPAIPTLAGKIVTVGLLVAVGFLACLVMALDPYQP